MLGHILLCHLLELSRSGHLPQENGSSCTGTKGCLIWVPLPMWSNPAVISWGIPSLKSGGCVPCVTLSTHTQGEDRRIPSLPHAAPSD